MSLTVPPTLRMTRDLRDGATQTNPTTKTMLELHGVAVEGLRKIGSKMGITLAASRSMQKDQLMQVIRQNQSFEGILF